MKCKQSNSAWSGERSEGYYNQQRRKPLRHLGMSRGDGECSMCEHTEEPEERKNSPTQDANRRQEKECRRDEH